MSEKLTGILRKETGKSSSRKARLEGNMPAVLYGQKDNLSFTVKPKALKKIIKEKGRNALIDLEIEKDSVKNRKVLLKDFLVHPLQETWLHADFLEIDVKKGIRVNVPVELIGVSPGEKQGGILNHIIRELDVECLPEDIPEKIEVHINALELGEVIHISDLNLSDKLKMHNSLSAPIVTVALLKEEVKEEETKDEMIEGATEEETAGASSEKTAEKMESSVVEGKSDKK